MISLIRCVATAIRARLRRKAMDGEGITLTSAWAASRAREHEIIRGMWLEAFKQGYDENEGPDVPISYEAPESFYEQNSGKTQTTLVGGWAERDEISIDVVIKSMAHDVGAEAARFLTGQEAYGVERYQQGELMGSGVDGNLMPEGYTPKHIQLIIKRMMGATDGTGDPLGDLKPGEVITTVGWKALCVREVQKDIQSAIDTSVKAALRKEQGV